MDINNISTHAGKYNVLPCVAKFVRILLVDHDTNSLMSLASQFEQQLYKVTTVDSATIALSLFEAYSNDYDIVIADMHMPEMGISEFVEKLHSQCMTIPIILISKDLTMDTVREALEKGVCYLFPKPPSHRDIATVWQHIHRVTGEMPSLFDMTNDIDIKKDDNENRKNLEMKMINNAKENRKRKQKQIVETHNSSSNIDEDDDRGSKKTPIIWTSYLHKKFLQAITILGEQGSQPMNILRLMNEPGLKRQHISSHLQIYRKEKRQFSNVQKTSSPVMPVVPPTAAVKNSVNTTVNNDGVQVPEGNGGVGEQAGARGDIIPALVNNDNLGDQGTGGSNQQHDGMPGNDDINQLIQELEADGINIWDLIN